MKIVLIDKEEGQKIGGISIYTHRIYQYLTSKGHEVYIFRFTKKQPKEKYVLRLPYYLAEPRSFIFLPTEKTLSIIKKYLIKIRPDIVYTCAGLSPLDFILPSLCHELGIPIAATWHADFNDTPSSYQLLAKSLFLAYLPFCQQLDLLHVFSEKLGKFYERRGINKGRILVLPNGVDPYLYKPGNSLFAKQKGIKRGILFLGRLTLQKNPEILLKTFLELHPSKDTKLILVGHGDLEDNLREEYKDRRIIFTGAIKDEKQKIDIINSCRIFVQPSRFEGMSLALLEAMSCGLACITSDAGANDDLLHSAGIVIPTTRLKQELPVALRILLEQPDFVNLFGRKARKRVLDNYSQNIIFNRLENALHEAISDYRKRGSPKTAPLEIDFDIIKQLKLLWRKAKQISSNF